MITAEVSTDTNMMASPLGALGALSPSIFKTSLTMCII